MSTTLSVYSDEKPRNRYFSYPVTSTFLLTPKGAKAVLEAVGFKAGIVYQDNVCNANGDIGTLAYRVYCGGRHRKFWWAYLDEETGVPDSGITQEIRLRGVGNS